MQETLHNGYAVPPSSVFDMHATPSPRMAYRPSLATIDSSNVASSSVRSGDTHMRPLLATHWQAQAQAGVPSLPPPLPLPLIVRSDRRVGKGKGVGGGRPQSLQQLCLLSLLIFGVLLCSARHSEDICGVLC